ncbi:MAG: acetyl-CoA carboxylase carboxyl transferase subunit beta, partial [Methyloprofundus sp.]|nr:acetyl-CoA carboxylase carboxyl transferase subunit beta [Methyloprofundus sp.]
MFMSWFEKLVPSTIKKDSDSKKTAVPEGLWNKCSSCNAILYNSELEKNLNVCPKCDHHMRIDARRRIDLFLDVDGREEIGANLKPLDPLKFKDSKKYKDRISQAQKKT